jgi:hypothetical protein|tara:strand:- start:226 stop:1650 length:1425 start_codon:yes stop_codon:yes gene_type:complete
MRSSLRGNNPTAEAIELGRQAGILLAQRSFVDFLDYAVVEDEWSATGVKPMEKWPHLAEMAIHWGNGESEIGLKARQLGFSWLAADLAVHRASYRKSATVLMLSQGEDEAAELLRKSLVVYEHLPPGLQAPLAKPPTKTEVIFQGGGRIIALPATEKAGRGYKASLVIVDEAAKHPYAQQNYAAYRPTVADGGQLIMIGTANGKNFFAEMFWRAWNKESDYTGRFVPWSARPGRTPEWYDTEYRNFGGHEDDFRAEYPATPNEAFAAKEGLVYPLYDDQVGGAHVQLVDPWPWHQSKVKVAGVDFGGGDPTAIISLGMSGTRAIHQFDEFYTREPVGVDELGAWLSDHGPFHAILCDPSEPVAIQSLKAAGLPAMAADNRRDAISLTTALLKQGRLTIAERCGESRKEFAGYRRRNRRDPNSNEVYATSTPVNNHADAMDARRYALCYLIGAEITTPAGRPQRLYGGTLARKAV